MTCHSTSVKAALWTPFQAPIRPYRRAASAFCKHPPVQLPDDEAFVELERFIRG